MTRHIANCADSLMVIKKLCFEDKVVSTRELYDALLADWKGYEELRQYILNKVEMCIRDRWSSTYRTTSW